MSKKMKWKERLLSSSLPLEFEVANFLAKEGFFLEPDYKYQRTTNELVKECSIDLDATLYFSLSDPDSITSSLQLMVECKYRAPNKVCLFLPEILSRDSISNVTLGRTLSLIDEFSFDRIPKDYIYAFEGEIPVCYKGVDVNLVTGAVEDKEINEGIDQLMYSLPQMHFNNVTSIFTGHLDDIKPYFAISILITNADLRILKPTINIKKIQKTEDINTISHSVPYLIFYKSHGSLFKKHSQLIFTDMHKYISNANLSSLQEKLIKSEIVEFELNYPQMIMTLCAEGHPFFFNGLCHQFLICNLNSLPILIKHLKETITSSLKEKTNFR
jgi:hypothetical protein